MSITIEELKNRAYPLDCLHIKQYRGEIFRNKILINYENTDFSGCVLYHCYPSGLKNAIEVNPAKTKEELSLKGVAFPKDIESVHLEGANLAGIDMEFIEFFDFRLAEANLAGAILANIEASEYNFSDIASMEGAEFESAYVPGANFCGLNLKGAGFSYAEGEGAYFHGSDLRGANFLKAELVEAELEDAKLQGAIFREANLERATFSDADLRGADFTNANIEYADFQGADLRGADFSNVDLDGSNRIKRFKIADRFSKAKFNKKTKLPDVFDAIIKDPMIFMED